jgi:hypothetical protein
MTIIGRAKIQISDKVILLAVAGFQAAERFVQTHHCVHVE